jgi:hypothetical protein
VAVLTTKLYPSVLLGSNPTTLVAIPPPPFVPAALDPPAPPVPPIPAVT